MANKKFAGEEKVSLSFWSGEREKKMIAQILPLIPSWIKGCHFTLLSLPISLGVVFSYYLAEGNRNFLWVASLFIIAQWISDSLDGALGRFRDEGHCLWGFYMDHFFDFLFLVSIVLGYSFLFNGPHKVLVLLFIPVLASFMLSSVLSFGITRTFNVVYFGVGPTDLRFMTVVLNILIFYFGVDFLKGGIIWGLVVVVFFLIIFVYRSQREILELEKKSYNKNC